jgi:hypothetical protein
VLVLTTAALLGGSLSPAHAADAVATLDGAPTAAGSAATAAARFSGLVTDALRTPTHRLAASAASGRAAADLIFSDAERAHTTARTCVRRRDVAGVRTCFEVTTGAAGARTVTPLRFRRGSYLVRWSVNGAVVAHWRFVVV